ncbi:MAG: CHAT domain-containing protein, partial [Methylococcaceae bacterium]|nr:CHAT domain-containing protein [Methylococcaceae bacterium]
MNKQSDISKPLLFKTFETKGDNPSLPSILQTVNRSGSSAIDPLLAGVKVEAYYPLSSTLRGGTDAKTELLNQEKPQLLAIETEDGQTLFIRSDKLAEDIARIRPEAVNAKGEVDFSQFRNPEAAQRGISDVFWTAVSVLTTPKDALLDEAKKLAAEWALVKGAEPIAKKVDDFGSVLGAKALMWAIESRLAGRSGLYHWQAEQLSPNDRCLTGDPRLTAAAQGQPMLVFIHGTASNTLGSYSALRENTDTWDTLTQRFPGGIFGFEHRTFSQSPIENALELLKALPPKAQVSIVTHSRGGLVGDLLCLGQVQDEAIATYRINTQDAEDPKGLEREAHEEQDRLREIIKLLRDKNITVTRYVRVACPARGTRLLSDNLDAALSDFLNLVQFGGSLSLGVAANMLAGPVAAENVGSGVSSALGVLKRLVLEIADKRLDPRLIPGIAAMCIDSPLAAFLAHPETRRHDNIKMAVIAGDTEFESFTSNISGFSDIGRYIGNLFCDWRLFDQQDNDLVVDTESMFAGLGQREGAYYLYDQDAKVSHFRYFSNPLTRVALGSWLVETDPTALKTFSPLTQANKTPWHERTDRSSSAPGQRPVVIVIPGIMGSHIAVSRKGKVESRERVWFDAVKLGVGKLAQIADITAQDIIADDIFELFYGDLADHLTESHTVIRCAYDWRKSLSEGAQALNQAVLKAIEDNPKQPIRLLAHSMGGLITRTMMKQYPETWAKVIASGGRLVMLGTPNNGSHQMVHTLLGKTDSIRMLEKLDLNHNLQEILDIVCRFPGALSLLPRPGFIDAGNPERIPTEAYFKAETWQMLKTKNTDRWYPNNTSAEPAATALKDVYDFWQTDFFKENIVANPERVSYVFGQSSQTPCGVIQMSDGKLRMVFTASGDGSVTWESGKLKNLPEGRYWYMPVEHADLTDTKEYFPAIIELLEKGSTEKLAQLPRSRGEMTRTFELEAKPPVIPTADELARAFYGSGPRRRKPSRIRQNLGVSVFAGDIRYLDQTILCGHYIGDAISGAEAILDERLDGCLTERERLGIYANHIGTSAIVLHPANAEQRARGSQIGAIIVGLGEFNGQLSSRQLTETVRAAVLRYLLQLRDLLHVRPEDKVELHSLLLGCNSTAHITINESVAAITCGVLEANWQFSNVLDAALGRNVAITDLSFVELYRDAAITAAYAVTALPEQLESDLKRLGASIEPCRTLIIGSGVRERLQVDDGQNYWPRLMVIDPDALEGICPPEYYETSRKLPLAHAALNHLCAKNCDCAELPASDGEQRKPPNAALTPPPYYPQRLKYVLLSQRARAEQIVQQRQPGLIEAIVREQSLNPNYDAKLGRTLFQLMVPLDYKAAAREQSSLLLVVDQYTAALPWELLQAEDEPMAIKTRMVRQMATFQYRNAIRTANSDTACIIVAPDTAGFDQRFPRLAKELPALPGAVKEGEAVRESLRAAQWLDSSLVYCGAGKSALDILAALYERPYRLLMISGHGVFEAEGVDGQKYSGVVLSNGLLLTAVEIKLMEIVPEVVFLNCCHLGSVSNAYTAPGPLAYSLANQLIEMGVRCVIAAGWAVNDAAACTFAQVFFDRFTGGDPFGQALFEARRRTYQQHPASNTWGAYQAYGDPTYRLTRPSKAVHKTAKPYIDRAELLDALQRRLENSKVAKPNAKRPSFTELQQWVDRVLSNCPPDWRELPEVLQALGALYAEQGEAGFAAARDAYSRALQVDGQQASASLKVIEQLANMESRQGEKLAQRGEHKAGMALIDRAIERLTILEMITRHDQVIIHNAERAALLGSAYKRKASALLVTGAEWSDLKPVLLKSAKAYLSGTQKDQAKTPYNTLNALPLSWLCDSLETLQNSVELSQRCGEQARRQFSSSKSFWDAVMSADAEMTAWLLGKSIDKPLETLCKVYDDAVVN